jgi:hypothetical protein
MRVGYRLLDGELIRAALHFVISVMAELRGPEMGRLAVG